jgi:hypothetical protein
VGPAALLRSIFVVASAASQSYSAEIGEGQPPLYAFASMGSRAAVMPLDGGESGGKFRTYRSELDHGQTGDSLEIAEVQRRDFVAKMQRCRADQQILERKLDAHRFLLAFDAPG